MSIFQKSVENKYLNELDSAFIDEKFAEFQAYFGNPQIQENIRNSKEEQFQEGFLRELFVKILGYTLNPEPDFNLTTELKNIANSKKVDGAILKNENAVAVIELKGTDTTDLDKVEAQAFGYKNHHPECVYVITSNFEKLRFYIQNAVNHIDFDLFNLTKTDFSLLWLCVAKTNLLSDLPLKMKEASVLQEENITKKLYADYSRFREEIYANLVKNNPDTDKLILFKKTQKLLDRFLFIFFAEDRLLLPPNSISEIVKQWETLRELDNYVPLYERFKKYFGYMNTGHKGKQHEIFAYNGGLFAPDEILDNIQIDDDLLHDHTLQLSSYDFETDVDVNILGHIFEHSLNEIEHVQAEIRGEVVDAQKTKRKKDGIFYTPKYITKYIVENTVGKLCEEKKTELGIDDEEYAKGRKSRKKETIKELDQKLTDYRDWLLDLTIIDPACGSGAFLNQTLDFLIQEHQKVDELRAQLLGGGFIFSDISTDILERNIYGVDLNEESVEIAKLSLWLRTAQKGRKLNSLNNNIKCGNSLIDDPEIAGEKAFNWEKEFPEVFAKGGFDVVVGNPPYVLVQPSNTDEQTLNYYKEFKVASYKIDLFHLFFEKSIQILKVKGLLGFITPNTYLTNKYIQKLRGFILENSRINTIINFEDAVFAEASVDVATIILEKEKLNNYEVDIFNSQYGNLSFVKKQNIEDWIKDEDNIFNIKIALSFNFTNCLPFEEIGNSYFGIQAFDRKSSIFNTKENDNCLPIIDGSEIERYAFSIPNKFFDFIPEKIKSGGDYDIYKKKRIVVRQIGQTPIIGICEENILASNTLYSLYIKENKEFDLYYVLAILNSNFIKKYWLSKYSDGKQLFPKIKGYQLKQLPIKDIPPTAQQPFILKADLMLSLNKELQEITSKFHRTLEREFSLKTLSKKLETWYELSYADFLKELKKQKVELSLGQKSEWEEYFVSEQGKALALQTQINATDKEIDNMVYELYGLTEEEIKIVEGEK
ncbi:MAG: N-6 DNA methylase [Brumimicrobium sp.]|nr:N-6 DNA methylase [Brumimicrobium sp.]